MSRVSGLSVVLGLAALLSPAAHLCAASPALVEKVNEALVVKNAFHLVGIPGVKRNGRVDVNLTAQTLVLAKDGKAALSVPYSRVRRLHVLDGTRTYAKATYASMVAFGLPGMILLAKKSHVDTLVFDYQNERGGETGLIVQVPAGQGAVCRDWLVKHGVQVEEPEPLPAAGSPSSPR